ncbi:hypothetical protein DFH09DRAFT_1167748 [Mycena vulgaris]|nr:hypothetical protein DFH09DRAFT_1167748 [Mycena vulgaris]
MPSSISTAILVEACLENLLYGLYVVLFTTVIYLFRSRREGLSGRRPARWVLLGLITQFLVITAHWVSPLSFIFFAIVHLGGGAAAEVFYVDLSTPFSVLNITLLAICAIVTDLLVIYRLYVICAHQRNIILFPLVLLVGQAVCGSGLIHRFVKWDDRDDSFIAYTLNGWVTANLVLSIMISTYSSGMISWKILRTSRGLNRLSEHNGGGIQLVSLLAILVESAALQTTTTIGILVTFQVGFVGETVLAGIAPADFSDILIHARIGLGWAHDPARQIEFNPTRINFAGNEALEEHELEDGLRK